ncbi:multidrug effflux MFS transporter [Vibrio salinus]|uniref:multidrug effflux MFS transporter n=1 Tax=Vibrio salinus TaxID=2899784 RepID=UPI001E2F83A5|nr:multidrug effflux MFS transporter [Vibrio salinus]MCE0495369.1 multidrug effflux MFS transporter [Vibrio salinus]
MSKESITSASDKKINKLALVATFGILSAFAPFSTDMYLSSFPSIADSLNTSISNVQYSLSTYFVGLAFGQLLYAPIIDRYGRKIPMLMGILLFSIASALIIFSPDIGSFVGFRLLQAIGGCAGMVVSRVIIQDLFNQRESASALSLMMMIQGVGPIAAPLLGAYLHKIWGWESVFLFLAILGVACFLISTKTVPETLEKPVPINVRNVMSPFYELFKKKEFVIPLLSGSLALSTMFIFISGSPFVFMSIFGVSQEHYSWIFGAYALGMVCSGQLNQVLMRKHSPFHVYRITLVFLLIMSVILCVIANTSHMWLFMIPLFFCIATVPVVGANSTALAMSVSGKYAGSASSIVGVVQFGFASLSSALVSGLSDGTTYPLTVGILVASALALLFLLLGKAPSGLKKSKIDKS